MVPRVPGQSNPYPWPIDLLYLGKHPICGTHAQYPMGAAYISYPACEWQFAVLMDHITFPAANPLSVDVALVQASFQLEELAHFDAKTCAPNAR
eukprot:s1007_g10.t1